MGGDRAGKPEATAKTCWLREQAGPHPWRLCLPTDDSPTLPLGGHSACRHHACLCFSVRTCLLCGSLSLCPFVFRTSLPLRAPASVCQASPSWGPVQTSVSGGCAPPGLRGVPSSAQPGLLTLQALPTPRCLLAPPALSSSRRQAGRMEKEEDWGCPREEGQRVWTRTRPTPSLLWLPARTRRCSGGAPWWRPPVSWPGSRLRWGSLPRAPGPQELHPRSARLAPLPRWHPLASCRPLGLRSCVHLEVLSTHLCNPFSSSPRSLPPGDLPEGRPSL